MAVDWNFIRPLEGRELKGYVPDAVGSQSGVTVGVGVDLGQTSAAELQGWVIGDSLKAKLGPYCGLRTGAAAAFLAAHPLTLTDAECDELDAYIQGNKVAKAAALYDGASPVKFNSLPGQAQTVIASVAFQYGHLPSRCPKFWAAVINQNWTAAVFELRNFGDRYSRRRNIEADYLAPIAA